MIYVTNRFDARLFGNEKWDYNLAIVRSISPKAPLREGEKQLVALSPSTQLFGWYYNLKKNGQWTDVLFQTEYTSCFLQEMQSPQAKNALNQLYKLDKAGKKIALTCFCPNEESCHRSIVGGLLQGVGCNVIMQSGKNYSEYYQLYKQIGKIRQVFGTNVPIRIN